MWFRVFTFAGYYVRLIPETQLGVEGTHSVNTVPENNGMCPRHYWPANIAKTRGGVLLLSTSAINNTPANNNRIHVSRESLQRDTSDLRGRPTYLPLATLAPAVERLKIRHPAYGVDSNCGGSGGGSITARRGRFCRPP